MPFLTELDERAEVKGSRDPLGLVPIWSRFGREVVGNLTTVTGSVRGFTTLLIGLELADMLREQYRSDAPQPLDAFLRFEQLAGYARVKCQGERGIRGYRRVSRRLAESRRIRISADPEHQILSNQRTYGLWGLFTIPARQSELVLAGEPRLSMAAREFVHRHYFSMLRNGRSLKALLDLMRRDAFDLHPDGRDADLLEAVGRMHNRKLRSEERLFYRDSLAWGGPVDSTQGRQQALAEALEDVATDEFGFAEFRAVQKKVRKNEPLAAALEKIGHLERLIAPAALVFGFLQDRDGQTRRSVARQLADTWSRPLKIDVSAIDALRSDIARAVPAAAEVDLWLQLAQGFAAGHYEQVIDVLVAMNAAVMQRRHGAAAWIVIEASGRIRVRITDERADLVPVEQAEERWRSTYFINALWRVSRDVAA
jgi:hypothetical protein